jgi:hypothetical protein
MRELSAPLASDCISSTERPASCWAKTESKAASVATAIAVTITERLCEIGDNVWGVGSAGGRPSEAVCLGGRPWNGLCGKHR